MRWTGALRTIAGYISALVENRQQERRMSGAQETKEVRHYKVSIDYGKSLTLPQLDCLSWLVYSSKRKTGASTLKIVQEVVGLVFASAHQLSIVSPLGYSAHSRRTIPSLLHSRCTVFASIQNALSRCATKVRACGKGASRKTMRTCHFWIVFLRNLLA